MITSLGAAPDGTAAMVGGSVSAGTRVHAAGKSVSSATAAPRAFLHDGCLIIHLLRVEVVRPVAGPSVTNTGRRTGLFPKFWISSSRLPPVGLASLARRAKMLPKHAW